MSKGIANLQFGNAVQRGVASTVNGSDLLPQIFKPMVGRGPDFIGKGFAENMKFDITTNTPRAIAEHRARSYGQDIYIITYERPDDFTVFPP